ncbi:HDL537Wp [Eremothecium sinecaudum]|uniref:DNA-directed RNA polymerase n=1 Tax=Eremothecium sinecaudum TaxID=45286 RepID=A0A109UWS1_9SACH|nr:HDL537Wp [Eremothecium sinecaudum]AMD20207.1 HDL537Wp [Eremothecium sinecaudum]
MLRYPRLLKEARSGKVVSSLSCHHAHVEPFQHYARFNTLQQKANFSSGGIIGASADLGFEKSAKASVYTDFSPFDSSFAAVESAERSTAMSLWSLLEACLSANYIDRSYSILQSLYELKTHRHLFINEYNRYLTKYCDMETSTDNLKQKVFNDFKNNFTSCSYNDTTLAILIRHALTHSPTKEIARENIQVFLQMALKGTKSIMSNIKIFSINDYKSLYKELGVIAVSDMPESISSLVIKTIVDPTLNKESSAEHTEIEEEVSSVEKDAAQLLSVGTFGLRAVKHSLLGLSITDDQKEQLSRVIDPLLKACEPVNQSANFFDIYKTLKTPEERKAFDDFLEEFNQDRQRDLENRSLDAAKERWQREYQASQNRGDLNINKSLNVRLWEWYHAMLPLLKEEMRMCKDVVDGNVKGVDKERSQYAPYLLLLKPEKMCVITILELLALNSTGGVAGGMRTARAVLSVGKAVEMEFRSEAVLNSENQMFKEYSKNSQELKRLVQSAKSTFRQAKVEEHKFLWPHPIRAKIGSLLISMLIHVAKVPVKGTDPVTNEVVHGEAPAFCHTFQYRVGSKIGVLKLHTTLTVALSGQRLNASVQPQHLPMLVKPRPWTSWNSGGYLYTQTTLIRTRDSPEQIAYLKAVSDKLDNVYKGMNVLGDTPWTVNKTMLNIISTIWNSGEGFLDIPPQKEDVELPPRPPRDADPLILKHWRNECKFKTLEFRSDRSVRCDSNYKLEIARAFLGEKFYFPHSLDFRGRAYPIAPHFNHLGNDMCRSLLLFWDGRRLGPEGLKWLKIHLANLYGMDKAPFEDRIKFTEDNLEHVKESAENPLNGKGWWKKADKPWQCLATCLELNEAYKLENPEDFVSHQPVHQDGSCNGLQHYAALGGDLEGARQVNLVPSEKPRDVYKHVAKLVTERLKKAALAGDDKAILLQDKITRKIVKRTVMTNVYGVTFIGAAAQIDKELQDELPEDADCYALSRYLARHVFASIRELFHAAHLIQDWLAESAKKISRSVRLDLELDKSRKVDSSMMMTSVIWTTPLGLPVVQPYRDLKRKQIRTNLQTVFISDPFAINAVNGRRQTAGLPPNFIHSLDASHMLLSAVASAKHGLRFAAVHDSYWTHASDVDTMNNELRKEFVRMYSVDLIQRLKNEFDERYADYVEIKYIKKSSEIGSGLIALRRDISNKLGRQITIADEISMERERLKLLRSLDPIENKKGEEMVTTISFLEGKDFAEYEVPYSVSNSCMILAPMKFSSVPPKGEYDIKELLNSKYFFS